MCELCIIYNLTLVEKFGTHCISWKTGMTGIVLATEVSRWACARDR